MGGNLFQQGRPGKAPEGPPGELLRSAAYGADMTQTPVNRGKSLDAQRIRLDALAAKLDLGEWSDVPYIANQEKMFRRSVRTVEDRSRIFDAADEGDMTKLSEIRMSSKQQGAYKILSESNAQIGGGWKILVRYERRQFRSLRSGDVQPLTLDEIEKMEQDADLDQEPEAETATEDHEHDDRTEGEAGA